MAYTVSVARKQSRCGLCGAILVCDNCGPIEGGMVWVRKGEKAPSPQIDGVEGALHWACDRCLRASASSEAP